MLQVRRPGKGSKNNISSAIFYRDCKRLTVDSSDSQAVEKIRNDSPKVWGIIKE
jgi:hypothetical protein